MPHYPSTFETEITPLRPDDFSSHYGADAVQELADKGFVALAGVTAQQGVQIALIGEQKGIREFCPRDASPSRFGTRDAMEKWLGKEGGRGMTIIGAVAGHEGPLSPADIAALRDEDIVV